MNNQQRMIDQEQDIKDWNNQFPNLSSTQLPLSQIFHSENSLPPMNLININERLHSNIAISNALVIKNSNEFSNMTNSEIDRFDNVLLSQMKVPDSHLRNEHIAIQQMEKGFDDFQERGVGGGQSGGGVIAPTKQNWVAYNNLHELGVKEEQTFGLGLINNRETINHSDIPFNGNPHPEFLWNSRNQNHFAENDLIKELKKENTQEILNNQPKLNLNQNKEHTPKNKNLEPKKSRKKYNTERMKESNQKRMKNRTAKSRNNRKRKGNSKSRFRERKSRFKSKVEPLSSHKYPWVKEALSLQNRLVKCAVVGKGTYGCVFKAFRIGQPNKKLAIKKIQFEKESNGVRLISFHSQH